MRRSRDNTFAVIGKKSYLCRDFHQNLADSRGNKTHLIHDHLSYQYTIQHNRIIFNVKNIYEFVIMRHHAPCLRMNRPNCARTTCRITVRVKRKRLYLLSNYIQITICSFWRKFVKQEVCDGINIFFSSFFTLTLYVFIA